MRFHHPKTKGGHGAPRPHGRFIGTPHRKGVMPMDALNVPFGLDSHPMGSSTPIGGADPAPDAAPLTPTDGAAPDAPGTAGGGF